jgi:hypothetical protein
MLNPLPNRKIKISRFTGWNPAKVDGFLRVLRICSTVSFRKEVQLMVIHHTFTARN